MKLRHAALVAGLCYLLSPVSYAEFTLWPKLLIPGNVEQTFAAVSTHPDMLRTAFLCFLVTFLEDLVIAWALYFFLAPVDRALSFLASLFQVVYAGIALTGLFNLPAVYRMIASPEYAASFGTGPFHAQVYLLLRLFRYDYSLGLILFGIHLAIVGYLMFRSTYAPRWLGVVLAVDGLAWIVNQFQPYLYSGLNLDWLFVFFLGELIFMVWLLGWGSRLPEPG